MSKKTPGIRCTDCGSYYDRQDGECDCKANPEVRLPTHRIVEHKKPMIKTAYSNNRRINQAYLNFDFK